MSCGTRAQTSARAILMAPGSSVLSLWDQSLTYCWYCSPAYSCVAREAPLFGSQPRRPSCVCSGLEPHCRTSRCARPQPTPSPRCCSLTSLLGTAHCTYWYCHCGYRSWRPLITAGHPVRSSAPSPSCNRSGSGTPPPHRPAHYNCVYCCPPVRPCRALSISATRETITTPPPNVYSSQHRFLSVRQ